MSITKAKVAVREADWADLNAIVAMLADDILGEAREDPTLPLARGYQAAFEAIEADPNNTLFVAIGDDGAVVGCLQLTVVPGLGRQGQWRGQIASVRVAARMRGEGLGEQMVRHAIMVAEARGCGMIQLTTDNRRSDAHRFYERLGFKPTHVGMKLWLDEDRAE